MILWGIILLTFSYFLHTIMSFDFSIIAVVPAIIYYLLTYWKKRRLLFIFGGIYTFYLVFNWRHLLDATRLLLNEWILAFAQWGWLLPLQQVSSTDATIAISLLLIVIATFYEKSIPWLIISVILLSFLLQQPMPLLALCLFLFSCLLFVQYRKYQSISVVQLTIFLLICLLTIPVQTLAPMQQAGQQLKQWQNKLQYDETPATQFSNGELQQLQAFKKTATPAFHLVMQQPRPMYLKSFVGATYENGWSAIQPALTKELDVIEHLQQAGYFEQTQYAQATVENQNKQVSIDYINFNKNNALIPYELASTIEQFNPETWKSTNLFGTSTYTYSVDERPYNDYPAVASALYAQQNTPYLQLETYTNYLSHQYYTQLPKDVEILLSNHFEPIENQSYEQIIATIQKQVAKLTYNEKVGNASDNFLQTLLEKEQAGYSVHYATLATLLFRYYNIPARYVEGYIITNEDIRKATAYKEMTITSDSRHAWPEIYIDWIGWIPVEVTPGYADKMPRLAQTNFAQQQLLPNAEMSEATSAISQVQDQPLPDEPAKESNPSENKLYLWVLLLLPFVFLLWWYKRRKINKLQYYFMKMIQASRKYLQQDGAVYTIIAQLNMGEATEAYRLYNEALYQNERYTEKQLYQMKRLTKGVRKQLKKRKRTANRGLARFPRITNDKEFY